MNLHAAQLRLIVLVAGLSSQWLAQGWTVQASKITRSHGWAEMLARLGEPGHDWLLPGGVSPAGAFRLYSKEQKFKPDAGWTALCFAPAKAFDRDEATPSPQAG